MSSKTNTQGVVGRAKQAFHSISKWIHNQFVFSDSSLADRMIESMHAIRSADRQNREASKA